MSGVSSSQVPLFLCAERGLQRKQSKVQSRVEELCTGWGDVESTSLPVSAAL